MKEYVIASVLVSILSMSLVAATSTCATFAPGQIDGPITKFVARDGNATNVTLYTDGAPQMGIPFTMTFAKRYADGSVVPIEGLIVSTYMNSKKVGASTTNAGGIASFTVSSPGKYTFAGGDANVTFRVGVFNETPENDTAINTTNTTTANDSSSDNGTQAGNPAPQEPPLGQPLVVQPPAGQQANGDSLNERLSGQVPAPAVKKEDPLSQGWLYVALIIPAGGVAFIAISRKKNSRKTGLRSKKFR